MRSESDMVVGLYRRHARSWLAGRRRQMVERKWIDRFLDLLPAKPAVLDIGCGGGQPICRYLLERGCDLTGIDAAPEMIAIAREALPAAEWINADMRGLDLAPSFDGIVAWNSLFHLTHDDQRRMFPVLGRHARIGAALIFTSGWAHGESIGSLEGEPLYHASLDSSEYRELLLQNGFEVLDHVIRDIDCGEHTVWLARRRTV